jgi:hypothetical protein
MMKEDMVNSCFLSMIRLVGLTAKTRTPIVAMDSILMNLNCLQTWRRFYYRVSLEDMNYT